MLQHRAKSALLDINFLGFERLECSPYAPDLAPMDFEIFHGYRRNPDASGMQFAKNLKCTFRMWLDGLTENFMESLSRNGYIDIKSALMRRDSTLRNFNSCKLTKTVRLSVAPDMTLTQPLTHEQCIDVVKPSAPVCPIKQYDVL